MEFFRLVSSKNIQVADIKSNIGMFGGRWLDRDDCGILGLDGQPLIIDGETSCEHSGLIDEQIALFETKLNSPINSVIYCQTPSMKKPPGEDFLTVLKVLVVNFDAYLLKDEQYYMPILVESLPKNRTISY